MPSVDNRIATLHEIENFYRSSSVNDQTRDGLIERVLFQLMKFNPPNYQLNDIDFISTYLRLLVHANKMNIEVVAELIYWYLEGGDHLR